MQRLLYSVILLITLKGFSQQLTVTNLRCEYRKNPSGVDNLNPHFSWELQSNERNVLQTGYQVLVADDSLLLTKNIGNVWDSKKIINGSSIQVGYKGKALQPAKKYFWKVMVWDNKKQVSGWSNMATWQMGLLTKADWKNARWIAYEELNDTAIIVPHAHGNGKKAWGPRRNVLPIFRKEFSIDKK